MTQLDADGNCEFRSQVPSGSSQEVLNTSGQSKLYRTTGKRAPQMVAHLSVSADAADPAAQLYQQLRRLTKPVEKREPKPLQGITLLEGNGVRLVHSPAKHQLQCIIDFDLSKPSLESQLISHLQTVNQCLAINKGSIIPQSN